MPRGKRDVGTLRRRARFNDPQVSHNISYNHAHVNEKSRLDDTVHQLTAWCLSLCNDLYDFLEFFSRRNIIDRVLAELHERTSGRNVVSIPPFSLEVMNLRSDDMK